MTNLVKTVESYAYPLKVLFADKYDVDFYQREYSWQQKHIEDLVSDLSREFLKNWKPGDSYKDTTSYDPYFMGEIVLSKKAGRNSVIDGQQRITSLTLFLIYIMRTFGRHPDFPTSDVCNLIYSNDHGEKRFNLEIPERTGCMLALYNGQQYIMKSSDSPSVKNLIERYEDFAEFWDMQINESNIVHFVYWLMDKVVFSRVSTNDDEFAYIIFETMNDRGLSLTQVEMLRSYLLANIEEPDRTKSKAKFDDVVKRLTGIKLSSKTKAEFEFFRIYFRGHYAENLSQAKGSNSDFQRIGKEFHRWVRDNSNSLNLITSKDYVSFIDRIAFFAEAYEHINLLIEQRNTRDLLYLIVNHDYGITLQTALLLSAITYGDDVEQQDKKIKLVSKHLAKAITWRVWNHYQISQSSLEAPIYSLCKLIRGKNYSEIEKVLQADDKWYPKLAGTPTLNQQNRRRLTVLLSLITEIVSSGEGLPDYMLNKKESTEVEHVWADHYDQHSDECRNESEFHDIRNSIGDLLVLPKTFNASYGDEPYKVKVVHYIEQNVLAQSLNRQKYEHNPKFKAFIEASKLPFRHYEDFTRTSISERGDLYRKILLFNWGLDVDETEDAKEGTYSESNVLINASTESKAMYDSLKLYILSLDSDIKLVFKKLIAGFDLKSKRMISIEPKKNSIDLWINLDFGILDDPNMVIRDVTHVGHHGVGNCHVKIENATDIEYAKRIIDDAYILFSDIK